MVKQTNTKIFFWLSEKWPFFFSGSFSLSLSSWLKYYVFVFWFSNFIHTTNGSKQKTETKKKSSFRILIIWIPLLFTIIMIIIIINMMMICLFAANHVSSLFLYTLYVFYYYYLGFFVVVVWTFSLVFIDR